jgi:hypothetical protein
VRILCLDSTYTRMARARVLAGWYARAHARPPAPSATPRPTHEDLRPGFGSLIYCPKILLSNFEYLSYNLELTELLLSCVLQITASTPEVRTRPRQDSRLHSPN